MSAGGAKPAGSGRALRLDPLALPVRFRAADADADGRVRLVELYRDEVILRRSVRGIRMAVALPIATYRGVAMRLMPPHGADAGTVAVMLEHPDPALSVPLFAATEATDLLAEWRLWGRIFGLPLLAAADDGTLREAFTHLGAVRIAAPSQRRRRCGALRRRRPSFLMRRKPGRAVAATVHRGREIIARN
jgi:Family of unknown function (DUF6101)